MDAGVAYFPTHDGLGPAQNSDYDSVRNAAKALNLDLEEQIAPR